MRGITSVSFFLLVAPFGALAAPTPSEDVIPSRVHQARAVVTPAPCQLQLNPPPTEQESAERFEKFAHAFLETKNLTEAFEYIDAAYIVCLFFFLRSLVVPFDLAYRLLTVLFDRRVTEP